MSSARPALDQKQIVAIVGCQRSGTTKAGLILGAHPRFLFVDEDEGALELVERRVSWPAALTQANAKYRTPRADSDISHVALKLINSTYSWDELPEQIPGARYVFLVRDVRQVVASMLVLSRVPFVQNQLRLIEQKASLRALAAEDIERLQDARVDEWVKLATLWKLKTSMLFCFEKLGLPVHRLRYEALVKAPEQTVRALVQFIEVPFVEACLHSEVAYRGVAIGNTDRALPLHAHGLARWRDRLSADQESAIWEVAGPLMAQLGYTRV